MKIGINLLFLGSNTSSGVGKHTEALLCGFRKIDMLKDCILFVREGFYNKARELYPEATVTLMQVPPFLQTMIQHRKKRQSYYECRYLNRFHFAKAIYKAKVDLVFYPFNDCSLRFVKDLPNILVIHDLYYLPYPEYYGKWLYWYAKRKHEYFLKHANSVITVSDFLKNEILKQIKSSKDSLIHVIPNAVTIAGHFTNFVPVDGPYVLSVGSQTRAKNQITLLRAYNLIKKRLPHHLILLGRHQEDTKIIQEYIEEHDLDDRVLCFEGIPEEHQNSLYRHASLVVTPSLWEAFGHVPIEAALLEAPVITAKTSALPEVTLGLLNYYEPATDSHALAIKMIELLKSPPQKQTRQYIASIFAKNYDDASIANRYLAIFQSFT